MTIGWVCCCASACGRIGIDSLVPDAARDAPVDVPPAHIEYVGPFVARSPGGGSADSVTAQARKAGNAIVVQVSCAAAPVPSAVRLTAAGWMFEQLGVITASAASTQRSATFVAIAPDAVGATFTVTWVGSTCSGG